MLTIIKLALIICLIIAMDLVEKEANAEQQTMQKMCSLWTQFLQGVYFFARFTSSFMMEY